MLAHSLSSRSHLLIIYIIILMHTHITTVLMIRPSQEIIPDVRVDLDVCYSMTYYTHFWGEINCSSDCTIYDSQDHGMIRYSNEKGWQFMDKPFLCMSSCNFNTKELKNGYVIGNDVVSHESYLNYTCNPGFKKTTSNRIMCLDGIFVNVESDGNMEFLESIEETRTIFREYPLSNKDFSQLSNSVHKFVTNSDNWICNGYPAQKRFVRQVRNNKVPYKLLSNKEEKCYKDGHIDISHHREIGCIKEIAYPLTPVDSVRQNNALIIQVSIIGFIFVVFITVGIMLFYLARRRVFKAIQKRSVRDRNPQLLIGQQESAPTSSGEFCLVVFNKYSAYLTSSGELYPTENKHVFYSRSGKSRIACVLTPKSLRKNLSSDDFSWTIDSKYHEDDSDGVEYLPEDSERPQCSNTTENINSWSRHISERSKSESDISEKDLQSKNFYTRSHSDSIKPAAVCTVMEENNACVVNEDRKVDSCSQLERINESVKVCTVMKENNASVVNEDQKEESSSLEMISESVTVCTVMEENNASVVNEDQKEESSSLEMISETVTVCLVMEENNANVVNEDRKEDSSSQLERIDESVKVCTVMEENNASVVNEDRKEDSSSQLERISETVTVCLVMEENNANVVNEDRKKESSSQSERISETVTVCSVMEENNANVVNEDRKEESSSQLGRISGSVQVCKGVMYERLNLNDDSQTCKENATLHREDNDERETTPLLTDTNNMKHDGSSVSMLSTSLTEDGKKELQNRNGCILNANSNSDMNLCHLSSRGMDPNSSKWKSDPYIYAPSVLEKTWRAIKKIIFRWKDSHLQSFPTRREIDC